MVRGLYIAASGMLAEMTRQEQIANDLANAATPGYKPDRSAQARFGELLLANSRNGRPVGPLGLGVRIDEIRTDFTPAPVRETGQPLDFAIEGEGFFAVRTPAGVRYTRNGQFTEGAAGLLVDQLGNPVLTQNGGTIRVRDGIVDPGLLGVFAVPNAAKAGDGMFTGAAAGAADGRVRSGALEGSGVDAAKAMVDMIASLRAFEAGQKAIQTIDSTLQRAATQVGNVTGT